MAVRSASWIVLHDDDAVAIAVVDLEPGDALAPEGRGPLAVRDRIPAGHKIALRDFERGDIVRKWGEPVGRVTRRIEVGEHVHVHNLESSRLAAPPTGDPATGAP